MEPNELEHRLQTLREEVFHRRLNAQELKNLLKAFHKAIFQHKLSEYDFVSVVLDMLKDNPSPEIRDFLRDSLAVMHIYQGDERIVHYWEMVLYGMDSQQREIAFWELSHMADRSIVAYGILQEYQNQESTADALDQLRRESLTVLQQNPDSETLNLQQYLDRQRRELSESDFFSLVADMLGTSRSKQEMVILQGWFMTYAHCDTDRVIRYWQRLLHSENIWQRAKAVNYLFVLAQGSTQAYHILKEFLGEEPTEKVLKERYLRLFDDATNGQT